MNQQQRIHRQALDRSILEAETHLRHLRPWTDSDQTTRDLTLGEIEMLHSNLRNAQASIAEGLGELFDMARIHPREETQ